MNYVIFDMEWNQAINAAKMVRNPVTLHGEIIQIGAVKTDESFSLVDKLKLTIRPKYYKKMNPHVEKITGITDLMLTAGETFPQAFRRFSVWCGEEFRFITWGFDDVAMLSDNLKLHGMEPNFGSDYINLQLIYNKQVDGEHLQCALSSAAEKLEIPIDVQVHDAMNDAYLTNEVLKKLDMVKGIAEYSELSAAVSTPIYKDEIDNVQNPKNMTKDVRVSVWKCPACGKPLTFAEWLYQNGKTAKTIARCSGCPNIYTAKLKAIKISEEHYIVVRTLYAADKDDESRFLEKLRKRDERRKKAAMRIKKPETATEENNDNNGTV